jgi:hypothetical protein
MLGAEVAVTPATERVYLAISLASAKFKGILLTGIYDECPILFH